MDIIGFAVDVCKELSDTVSQISREDADAFLKLLLDNRKRRIFIFGAGRCGYVLRAFCMRLMHLGFSSYFVTDTNTPAVEPGDIFIVADGAGYLTTVSEMTRLAKSHGATVVTITILPESDIGSQGDLIIQIPGRTTAHGGVGESIQPGGGKFEQSLFIFLDCIIAAMVDEFNLDKDSAFVRHNNLE